MLDIASAIFFKKGRRVDFVPEFLKKLWGTGLFMPHGHCFLWRRDILALHVVSDVAIALAYYSIPLVLLIFVRRRPDFKFPWIFYLFASFIMACGTTHIMEILTIWKPAYYLQGLVKLGTAIVSVITAIKLWPLLPQALDLPSPEVLRQANERLLQLMKEREIASEHRFRQALEASPQSILVVDQEAKIEYANAQTQTLFGYAPEELIGAPVDQLIPNRFHANHAKHMADFQHAPKARAMGRKSEVFGMRHDGTEFPVEIALGPFHIDGSLHIIGFVTDISLRKQTDEHIQQQKLALKRSNDDLESFAYAASHDLQEPLRAVTGYLQLLRRQFPLPEKATRFLENALEGSARMRHLMDSLLEYSRIGQEASEEEIDLQEIVTGILRDQKVLIEETGADIEIFALPRIRYNPVEINQIFSNLINNALKFRQKEHLPMVRIGMLHVGHEDVFYVTDNGTGISPEFQSRLFQPFQRLHNRAEYPGSGIGLALVAKAIRTRGGRIWMESEPGRGSTFYFTLINNFL